MVHLTVVPNMTLAGFTVSPSPLGSFRVWAVSRAGTALYTRMPEQLFTDTQISSVAYKTPWKNYREGMILPVDDFACICRLILPMDDTWIMQSAGLHKHKVMQCLNHYGLTLVS